MAARWKLLIVVGIVIVLLDQWTKFLAVEHLTPGIVDAHRRTTHTEVESSSEIGSVQKLGYFYADVEHPCRAPGARCPPMVVIPGLWLWSYAENPGAAWSFLANASEKVRVPFFLCVSVLAIILILWFFARLESHQRLLMVALSLVLGGAVGNLIDRARLQYVIDFIVWYIGSYRWPTFNVADAAISTGVGLMLLDSLLDYLRSRSKGEVAADKKTGEADSRS